MNNWPIDESESISPRPHDVLCQRGNASISQQRNSYFRHIIESEMPRYQIAPDRIEKSLIVNDIVQSIVNNGGRFLKRNANKDDWTLASIKDAKDKVSYTLRRLAKSHETIIRDNCMDSFAMASLAHPASIGPYEFDKREQNPKETKQSASEAYRYASKVKSVVVNDDDSRPLQFSNCLGDQGKKAPLKDLHDDKSEASFLALIDSYNEMPLKEVMSDERTICYSSKEDKESNFHTSNKIT